MILPLTPIRFLLEAAENYGRKVGIVDGEKRLTYSEMLDRSSRLAAALRNLGIEDGDRVATLSFNCHQLLEAYYGVPIARAVLLSLNVRLSPEEQTYILEHSGSKIVLFDPEFQPLADVLHKNLPAIQWVALEARDGQPDWVHPWTYKELLAAAEAERVDFTAYDENALAELFYTSGSTGRPKGVMLSHRTLYLHALYAIIGARRRAGNVAADRMCEMHTIPLFHANGWGRPHTITFAGGRHVIVKRFDPAEACELIARESVTAFSMVPTMAATMVNFPGLGDYDLSSLQEVFVGGAAPSAALIGEIEEKLGCRAFAGYGMTETSPVAAIAHVKDTLGEITEGERVRRQAMTGTALGGVEVRVAAPDGKNVPKDGKTVGEILFRSDVVMDGYWREPEATAEAIENNWLHSGDMAVWDEENYLLIVDRKKDIIISGGENISSIEIEKVLAGHAAVYEVAVVGVPDEKWGEVPAAFVVLKPDASATEDELRGFVRNHLAGFKAPKSVEFRDELPKGATGKILKRALRDPYWEGMERRVHGSG